MGRRLRQPTILAGLGRGPRGLPRVRLWQHPRFQGAPGGCGRHQCEEQALQPPRVEVISSLDLFAGLRADRVKGSLNC